jgi:hypothetical protein
MKFAVAALLASPAVAAFQAPRPAFASTSQLFATETKAASSFEEDLALTLQIILDHDKRSTTVSKDQFMHQMQEVAAEEIEKEPENIAPDDAADEKAAPNENKLAEENKAAEEKAAEKNIAEAKAAVVAQATNKEESQVAEGPKTPSIGKGEAASHQADMVTCSVCAVPKAKSDYTKTQLKKKTYKCKECVAEQTSVVIH